MKKLVYIAAAFAAILACSKESQAPQEPQDTNNDNTPEEVVDESKTVHELFVSLPDFTDAETKAVIDDASGSFSWTVGDKIAVVDDSGNVYPFVASEAAQSVRFTYVGAISGTLQTIYYPYTEEAPYYITDMPTALSSETAALSSSNIRLTGSIVGNSATLYHKHAFVRLKFENVPSFAKKIQFYEAGNETPTLVTLTGTGSVTAYLPVHGGTQAITASLIDANNNEIIKKYHDFGEENAFVNGSIKNMRALTVGHVFTFKNNAGWINPRVSIWNGSETFGFKSIASDPTAAYPWKLNSLGNNTYYIVINDDVVNGNSHVFANDDHLGVWFGNDDKGSSTDQVYLYRDIDFTIPVGGGLKTDYRVYFNNSSRQLSVLTAYVWGDAGIYVYWENWNDKQVNAYSEGVFGTGWVGMTERKDAGGTSIWFYEFPDAQYRTQLTAVQIGVSSSYSSFSGDDVNFTNSNHVYWKNGSDAGHTRSELRYIGNLNGDYPGNSILSNKVDGQDFYYYQFSSDYYGYGLNVIFRGQTDDAFKSADTHYLVNQDYWYN